MTSNVKAHIISYFGSRDYPEARKVRVDNHRKQVEFWKEYYPDMQIKILAQDYDDEDYIVEGDRICIDHHIAHIHSTL